MKEIVLITGANGLIAGNLSERLSKSYSVRYLTRKKKKKNEFEWDVKRGIIDDRALIAVNHIIHLAGANIAEKRWTEQRKQEIVSSRINSAKLILNALKQKNIQLNSFISASAIGFYGTSTNENIYTEDDIKGTDFLSDVVFQWEQIADEFLQAGLAERVVKIRTGLVLAKNGAALPKMMLPVKYYLGASLGRGNQFMSWIHIEDIAAIYEFSLRNQNIKGVYNACSPHHTTNKLFTKVLAELLKKPLIMPNVPSFIIKLLFGESSVILLQGSRVASQKIIKQGFEFKYIDLKAALEQLLSEK